jgi:hypothetical protein
MGHLWDKGDYRDGELVRILYFPLSLVSCFLHQSGLWSDVHEYLHVQGNLSRGIVTAGQEENSPGG